MRTKYDCARLNQIEFGLVAERYGAVKRIGTNLYAECPWHDDKHPSLLIGGRKGNFCHCFSCGKSGSVIDYVMAVRNCDFKEACVLLHEEFGIPYEEGRGSEVKSLRSKVKGRRSGDRGRRSEDITDLMLRGLPRKVEEKGEYTMMTEWYTSYFSSHDSYGSTFIECLRRIVPEEYVRFVVEEYKLGSWENGYVMFPSIDMDGEVHNVKIQRYCTDMSSPKFFHKEDKSTYWLGAILDRTKKYDSSCFFGMHLLAKYPEYPVVLVESPKNALIGACSYTGALWIAVGSKNNMSAKKLECLRDRNVIVIPDADALEEWKAQLKPLSHIAPFEFSSFCETVLGEQGKKGDVADYLIGK